MSKIHQRTSIASRELNRVNSPNREGRRFLYRYTDTTTQTKDKNCAMMTWFRETTYVSGGCCFAVRMNHVGGRDCWAGRVMGRARSFGSVPRGEVACKQHSGQNDCTDPPIPPLDPGSWPRQQLRQWQSRMNSPNRERRRRIFDESCAQHLGRMHVRLHTSTSKNGGALGWGCSTCSAIESLFRLRAQLTQL